MFGREQRQEECTIQQNPRVNEEIDAAEIRLISEDGEQLGVVPVERGMEAAAEAELDLVEVAPNSKPPVCRVMNFGKYKYEQQKKEHASRKRSHTTEIKELRLGRSIRIEQHDLDFKTKKAREILDKGYRLMVFLQLRGRENAHADLGVQTLNDLAEELSDVAKVESPPRIERRRINMLLVPMSTSKKDKDKDSKSKGKKKSKGEGTPEEKPAQEPSAEGDSGSQEKGQAEE